MKKIRSIAGVVFLVSWISGCGAALPGSTKAVETRSQLASAASKLPFVDTIPDVIFTGESEGSYFSVGLAVNGDLNGDGYADIVIGAPNHNNFRGRVYIYFGGKKISATPDLVITGETKETRLGQRVALGDVNNDGYDDLLTGGWGYKSRQGQAYLYYGGKKFDGAPDKVFEGEKGTVGRFGLEVTLGDVNNDGYADLTVTADKYGSPKGAGPGRVYLYYGASGTEMDTTPDKIFDGEQSNSLFGRYLDMCEDVDGDGYDDLLIGAPLWNNDQGRAYLYYGGSGTTMDTTADLTLTGEHEGDRFARNIGLGDINGDDYADIVIGAARYKAGQGRAYIYYGVPRDNMNATADLTIDGEGGNDRADFGIGVVIGDLNNDGYEELLLGGDDCYNYRGRVCLYYGREKFDGAYELIFDGQAANIHFGRFMDIGDVNGDKYPDIVIGAWSYNQFQGRAYLYYGGPRRSEPTQLNKLLLQAAAEGNTEQAKSLISKGADINAQGENGNTPLHRAARQVHKEVVELLIDKGAKVNSKNAMGDAPLHVAAHNSRVDVAELLIAKGADVNARRHFGGTPLHCAVWGGRHREVTELLLAKGANVNVKDESGDTPLHYAAGYILGGNRDSMVKLLIAKGAIADSKNRLGQTPADFALTHPSIPTVLRLLATKDASVPNLHVAAFMGDSAKVQSFIEQGSDVNAKFGRGRTPLHYAAMAGSEEAAELLLAKGADVNAKGGWDYTPLYYAVYSGSKDMVELLLSKGADVNAKNKWGRTPIDLAMNRGRKEIAKLLLSKSGDVSLHTSAYIGDLQRVEKFIDDDGASVDAKDQKGQTALHYAAKAGQIAVAKLLIANGADVNAGEWTPLQEAAYYSKEMVELLLAKGADINTGKWTALHSALDAARFDIVELLLAKGADANIRDGKGRTPLHIATWYAAGKNPKIVELLLSKGADINAKDNNGKTALSYATENGHTEIVELLRKHGAKE